MVLVRCLWYKGADLDFVTLLYGCGVVLVWQDCDTGARL